LLKEECPKNQQMTTKKNSKIYNHVLDTPKNIQVHLPNDLLHPKILLKLKINGTKNCKNGNKGN
jgi:hypothetical protein